MVRLPHQLTPQDFSQHHDDPPDEKGRRNLSQWIHGFFDGFEDTVGDEVTTRALRCSISLLATRGVSVPDEVSLSDLVELLTPDEHCKAFRQALEIDEGPGAGHCRNRGD